MSRIHFFSHVVYALWACIRVFHGWTFPFPCPFHKNTNFSPVLIAQDQISFSFYAGLSYSNGYGMGIRNSPYRRATRGELSSVYMRAEIFADAQSLPIPSCHILLCLPKQILCYHTPHSMEHYSMHNIRPSMTQSTNMVHVTHTNRINKEQHSKPQNSSAHIHSQTIRNFVVIRWLVRVCQCTWYAA